MRAVAQDQAVDDQVALDRLDRPAHARVRRGQEADERDEQEARVQLLRRVRLHERPELLVEAVRADVGVDLVAQGAPALHRPVQRVLLDRAHGAVERDPRHDLRVDEVPPLAADLPDALVRLAPDLREVVEEDLLQVPRVLQELEPMRARLVQRVDHLPEHVDLQLLARGVADADGGGAFVAR